MYLKLPSLVLQCFLRSLAVSLLVLFSTVSSIFSQEGVIRIETDLVAVEVNVKDKNGKSIRGLESKDFRLFEDGVERGVDFFEPLTKKRNSRALAIVFVLDVSGSMTPDELSQLRSALNGFADRLSEYQAYIAAMTFGMKVKVIQAPTNRRDKLRKSIEKIQQEKDGLSSHAYDATDDAIRILTRKLPSTANRFLMRRAIIVVTDGFPVGDTVSPQTVIQRARENDIGIFALIVPSYSRMQTNSKPLQTPFELSGIVEQTGGRSFYADENNFDELFKMMAEEISSSYVLAFYPAEANRKDKRPHRIKITTRSEYKIIQNRDDYRIQ